MSARANKHAQFSPINQAILGVAATPQPNLAPMSNNKIQHIYDVIDRKSVKNREKMQQDLTRIYMMQVNNKQEQVGGSPMGQEIKKRADGEWGPLPANAASRNDLQPLADNSSG